MVNWCENKIITNNIILNILDIQNDKMLFEKLLDIDVEGQNGLFNRINYGTKWDVPMNNVDYGNYGSHHIYLIFDTACTPPLIFCKSLCKKYFINLEIEYYEGARGKTRINQHGEIVCEY